MNFPMIDESRNGVCGDDAIGDEWGPRGPHPPCLGCGWHRATGPEQAPIRME